MATESPVAIPSGLANVQIDTVLLTTIINQVTQQVLRQVMAIGDPNNPGNYANVSGTGNLQVDNSGNSSSSQIINELRQIKFLLMSIAGVDVPADLADTDSFN